MILKYKYIKHRINIYDYLWLKIYQQNINKIYKIFVSI